MNPLNEHDSNFIGSIIECVEKAKAYDEIMQNKNHRGPAIAKSLPLLKKDIYPYDTHIEGDL